MSEYEHTKAPWAWRKKGSQGQCELVGADGTVIYRAKGIDGELEDDLLVEAAPELLEALEIVLDSLGALTKPHELLSRMDDSEANKVWAALHKATGRPMP